MTRMPRTTALTWAVAAAVSGWLAISSAHAAPDEELLGKAKGYPPGSRATWFMDETVRVGSFSNLDRILPSRTVKKSDATLPLEKAAEEASLNYKFQGKTFTIDDYLSHQRATGLLVIKDGRILVERYQYERTKDQRLLSNSMAKSIVSMGIGIALRDGSIRSLDDNAADYVPELKDNAYGQTKIRDLLRMSSGVHYSEDYSGNDDSAKFSRAQMSPLGTLGAIKLFDDREAAPGTRFRYASIETTVLGLVLGNATGKHVADYVADRIWQPLGAESAATWIIAPDGHERFAGSFNATLRDWGRLGVLLANDGVRDGKEIVPREYLIEATDWHRHPAAFAPKGRGFGYGYQFWTFGGDSRQFALLGVYGQAIYVDPKRKLVLVHTAAARNARIGNESMGVELRALWSGLVAAFDTAGAAAAAPDASARAP